jgi:hypothetical protein
MHSVARSTLWPLLAVISLFSVGALIHPRAMRAQSGTALPVDKTSFRPNPLAN